MADHIKETEGKYAFNNERLYDFLKNSVQLYLPALATLYFSLGGIWGWPNVEQIIGTITAITVFLGVCLKISKTSYDNSGKGKDGSVVMEDGEMKRFEIDHDLESLQGKSIIKLRVREDDIPLD